MTVYASNLSGETALRCHQLQTALAVLELHQSLNHRCATCGTPSPCQLPAVVKAATIIEAAHQLPPLPMMTTDPRIRRALTQAEPVTVRAGAAAGRGNGGGTRAAGAPSSRRHFTGFLGDPARRQTVQHIQARYGYER